MSNRPIGKRFSHIYVDRGEPLKDSTKARRRISTWLGSELRYETRMGISQYVPRELGISINSSLELEKLSRDDFLDAITLIYDALKARGVHSSASGFALFASRTFTEENLGFEVDERAGVHYRVDQEFNRNLHSAIAGLEQTRFTQATASLTEIQAALDRNDTRSAVRHAFDAAENVFKVTLGQRVQRLGTEEIRTHLRPQIEQTYEGAARHAALKLIDSFQDWTAGAHFYRHVEGTEEAPPPPEEIAVVLISQGAAWVRWLVSLEAGRAFHEKAPPN